MWVAAPACGPTRSCTNFSPPAHPAASSTSHGGEVSVPSRDLTPLDKPLPPQRWGFLATDQFWARALLTPIAIPFWAGAAVFFVYSNIFALAWWQQALGFLAFYAVWGGLVERWYRRALARRRMLLHAEHRPALDVAMAPALPGDSSHEPVSPPALRPELPIVATAEFWDYAFERLFGRAAQVARVVFDIAFVLAIFHPTWTPMIVAILAAIVLSLCLGLWQRRLLRSQLRTDTRASPALAESSGREVKFLGEENRC